MRVSKGSDESEKLDLGGERSILDTGYESERMSF